MVLASWESMAPSGFDVSRDLAVTQVLMVIIIISSFVVGACGLCGRELRFLKATKSF